MNGRCTVAWGTLGLVLLGAGIVGCRAVPSPEVSWAPTLPPSPTLDQVAAVVNGNSAQIRSFIANQATLSGAGFATLQAQIVFERPKRLRIRGATSLSGAEVDLGANDDLYWLWVRRGEPPALYYCRRDRYFQSAARRVMPVQPDWLIEALGITEIDLTAANQGPVPLAGGRLEIRSVRSSPEGPTTKVMILEASRGLVLGQYIYDSRGQLAAAAQAASHRRDPVSGLVMPRVVDIQIPRAQVTMRVNLGNVAINQVLPNPAELWTLPTYPGYPTVNLEEPCSPATPGVASTAVPCQPCGQGQDIFWLR